MNEIGRILKEAREKKNLTLDQVATNLRVKEDYLYDIEEKSDLPRDVFTIGYIRLYARYLKINIDSQLNSFRNGEDVEEEEPVIFDDESSVSFKDAFLSKIKDKKYIKIVSASVVTVLLVVVAFVFFNNVNSNQSDETQVDVSEEHIEEKEEQNIPKTTIEKISQQEYVVKNISEDNDIFVVANDATMVSFLDEDNKVIDEVFVQVGEKKPLPRGHNAILIRTRILSAIDVVENTKD